MKRTKKQLFKYLINERFGSQTDAARSLNINYFRLSRFITGAINLRDSELENLRTRLNLDKSEFKKLLSNSKELVQ